MLCFDAVDTDPLIGTMLGPCRIEALVGRGGMGRVYRARHVVLDRVVAVKLVDHSASPLLRDAVLSEARTAAKLEDPRVVAVYDVGEDNAHPYIVMQWVEGEALDVRVKRSGPLSPAAALHIMRETVTALRAAHAAGLVHCDVKPPNILLDVRGAVKLADFGIARRAGTARAADETVAGSFHFMAPEQALGAPPDPRSDLYAVGGTWYFALTGQMLFPGTPADALLRHREETPPDVRILRPEVTDKTAALIRRLLSKDPALRPHDADAVLREMSAVGMLLETDASGSPFRILPAPPPDTGRGMAQPPAAEPAPIPEPSALDFVPRRPFAAPVARPAPGAPNAPVPPPAAVGPPSPAPIPVEAAPALGSRASFYAAFGVLAFVAVGWPWRNAVKEDWLAGAFALAAAPALLTLGDRRAPWRQPACIALWLGSLACLACDLPFLGPAPDLETVILAVLGALAAGGGAYLASAAIEPEEVQWARILSPLGGLLLAMAALTWPVPAGKGWFETLAARGRIEGGVLWATGGAWRWGGLAALTAALAAIRGMKGIGEKPAAGRNLNWNR